MGNKKRTIYELMGLIKDNKAPYEVIYQGTKYYIDESEDYYRAEDRTPLFERIFNNYNDYDALQEKVEILPEENDEWEDIEEKEFERIIDISPLSNNVFEIMNSQINSLIKNQKYLKEIITRDKEENKKTLEKIENGNGDK